GCWPACLAAPEFPAGVAPWVASLAPPEPEERGTDFLDRRVVEPRGPTPAEVAAAERVCGRPWQDVAAARPAPPVASVVLRRLGEALSCASAVALLLVALVEFLWGRRRAA